MKAVVFPALGQLQLASVPDPVPAAGEVVVRLRAAALNHRDLWIKSGHYAGLRFPCLVGSDGAGLVESLGPGVEERWLGREVVINPSFDWGDDSRVQGARFSILGLPRDGTLAEKIAVPAAQLVPRPPGLSWEEAAALPLAGLTAWRALTTRGQLRSGERVLLTGIGGGGALFALQFAHALGAEVWVTSSSTDKLARAVALGARGGADYTEPGWAKTLLEKAGPFSLIVDSAGGAGFGDLLDLAAPGGRIVFFGATRGAVPDLALRKVFWKQLSLLGTTMGTAGEFAALMEFVAEKRLRPVVDAVYPLERAAEAFARMERGGQFGKLVLTNGGGLRRRGRGAGLSGRLG